MDNLGNSAKLRLTSTGLKKSIFDATIPFRAFLRENNIHDYDTQKYGVENKVLLEIKLYKNGYPFRSSISLYRSKGRGDYRISIAEIGSISNAGDWILFTIDEEQLVCEKLVL